MSGIEASPWMDATSFSRTAVADGCAAGGCPAAEAPGASDTVAEAVADACGVAVAAVAAITGVSGGAGGSWP